MRRMKSLFRFAGFLAFSLFTGGVAGAVQLSGQAGLTLYGYQSQVPDTIGSTRATASNHLISTQILTLDLREFGTSGLSFHTFLRNTSRVAPSDSTGSLFRLYGAYLDYRRAGAPLALRAGRQFLVVGIANGTLDGLKVRYDLGRRASFTGFAGLESRYDSLAVPSWKDGGMAGGEVSLSLPGRSYLSLSGWQLNRDSVVAKRRIGSDLFTGVIPRTELSGHAEVDLLETRFHRLVLRAENHPLQRLWVNARLEHRQPVFSQGSIFNTFEASATQEAGAGLRLKACRSVSLSGEAVRELFDDDHADRLIFAVISGDGAVSYIRRTGRGGQSWGLALHGDHSLSDRVDCGAVLDFTKYEAREDPSSLDYTFTGIARLGLRIYKGLRISTDLENLVNPNYTQNTRLLVRALYDF